MAQTFDYCIDCSQTPRLEKRKRRMITKTLNLDTGCEALNN